MKEESSLNIPEEAVLSSGPPSSCACVHGGDNKKRGNKRVCAPVVTQVFYSPRVKGFCTLRLFTLMIFNS